MKDFLKLCGKLLGYGLHKLSYLVHRDKKKWAFGSFFKYGDNSKFLFIKANDQCKDIRPIWIANNRDDVRRLSLLNYEVYYWASLKGLYHTLTSGVFVGNVSVKDINRYLSGGAFFVDLWHGVSVKKIRWQNVEQLLKRYKYKTVATMQSSFRFKIETFDFLYRKPDLLLVPSKKQAAKFFIPQMRITEKEILYGAYPRDVLLNASQKDVIRFISTYETKKTLDFVYFLQQYKKVYVYMPTWRNDGVDFVRSAGIDWNKLNEVMMEQNALLLLKLHPHTKLDLSQINNYPNIRIYPSDCDIYTILPFTDCLITDYSSIYSEYCIMKKEIILFIYDYEQYVRGSYGLEEYDTYFQGIKAYDFNELYEIIKSGKDCHLSDDVHDFMMDFYWSEINNGLDIIKEIKKKVEL